MIVFVRHGQTEANRDGLLIGRADSPLTAAGQEQAERVATRLAARAPLTVLSSPLRRALDTAALIAAAAGCGVDVDERLIEIDYGEWDGRALADLPADVVARWRSEPDFAPPGGESLRIVGKRMAGFCEERLADGAPVIAVSHVSPIKAAVCWTLGVGDELAWRMRLDVGGVTRIGPGPVLLSFNEPVG